MCKSYDSCALFALTATLLLAAGCTMIPAGGPDRSGGPGRGDAVPSSLGTLEHEVTSRVNAYRRSRGLPLLVHDDYLASLAREHSTMMASGRRKLGHQGFEARARQIQEQVVARSVSENVAFNNYPPDAAAANVVDGWIESPGHHANLIGAYNRAGVGAARSADGKWYVTQLYVWVQ